jgi:hypothetical protein
MEGGKFYNTSQVQTKINKATQYNSQSPLSKEFSPKKTKRRFRGKQRGIQGHSDDKRE